jgi:hypothetical protein
MLSVMIALVGLATASAAHHCLQTFGFGQFGYGCIKWHYDELKAAH